MLRVVNSLAFVLYGVAILVTAVPVRAEIAPSEPADSLIITEIKVRNNYNAADSTGYDEYIELHNPTSNDIALGDFLLEYTSASGATDRKPISQKILSAGQSFVLEKYSTSRPPLIPNSAKSPFTNLTDGGGWLRLIDVEGVVFDEIGWVDTASLATAVDVFPTIMWCSSTNCKDKGITKQKDPILGDYPLSNALWLRDIPSPSSSELIELPDDNPNEELPDEPINEPEDEIITPTPVVTCEGIVISELLPNPDGADSGREYIELFNPTDEVISLAGCSLQMAGSSRVFSFGSVSMQPGEYRAFYDGQTNLTLPNAADGKVWLLSPTEELQAIVYPGGLDEDTSWALVGGVWQVTYKPTPAAVNIALGVKPCPADQKRDQETGRCQSPVNVKVAALTPCKVGQERNPATGRCRSIATTVSALVPCKEGQERNPDTNRCRTITTSTTLKPCDAGEERNPDTNRCRKATSAAGGSALAAVTDVKSDTKQQSPKLWLAGSAVLLALGYAAFEWRRDIANWLGNLRARLIR